MPELPEVETTRRGISALIVGKAVKFLHIRQANLRWPIPKSLLRILPGLVVQAVSRRGKYLLLETPEGKVLIHLGMSGSLRVVPEGFPLARHDHVDIVFDANTILRFTDPRRFGSILWMPKKGESHPLLENLGPEPLSTDFNGAHLKAQARNRKLAVKSFIMDSTVVVGVGNIYANEALFAAGIHPLKQAGKISASRYDELAQQIKQVLQKAITQGGTTLRNFTGGDGKPGYFKQALRVYGRGGRPCLVCEGILKEVRTGQRSTVFCALCQR
jgi:formamidopyrimidine-DNA glycosylase